MCFCVVNKSFSQYLFQYNLVILVYDDLHKIMFRTKNIKHDSTVTRVHLIHNKAIILHAAQNKNGNIFKKSFASFPARRWNSECSKTSGIAHPARNTALVGSIAGERRIDSRGNPYTGGEVSKCSYRSHLLAATGNWGQLMLLALVKYYGKYTSSQTIGKL